MKYLFSFIFALVTALGVKAQTAVTVSDTTLEHEVLLETTQGNIRLKLYNDTPIHRDNFLKLVRSGFYDGLLFHRVIPNFMIQAGDSPEPYTLPAEIRFPQHFHRSGVLAAARESEDVNPELRSSASQFYIVTGSIFTDDRLDAIQQRLDSTTQGRIRLTPSIREAYRSFGGAPHLDGQYTVFGEVVEGYDVADLIQWVARDEHNRPFDDVRIVRATVVK